MVAAEDEENSPWEPLHVEHGFEKEDNTITLSFPQSYDQIFPYGTDDKGILGTIIYNLTPYRMGITGIILTPTNARSLARRGWTKKGIKSFIKENARVPWYRHPQAWGPIFESKDTRQLLNPQDSVAIIGADPRFSDQVKVYVFGGMGSWVGIASGGSDINTEKADLPAKWDVLVGKYKDIVPTYIRY
jgi:hypothetical protein